MRQRSGKKEQLRQYVIDKWMPVYAYAYLADVSEIEAGKTFTENKDKWGVELRLCRMDGHNPVLLVRKRQKLLIDDLLRISWTKKGEG